MHKIIALRLSFNCILRFLVLNRIHCIYPIELLIRGSARMRQSRHRERSEREEMMKMM